MYTRGRITESKRSFALLILAVFVSLALAGCAEEEAGLGDEEPAVGDEGEFVGDDPGLGEEPPVGEECPEVFTEEVDLGTFETSRVFEQEFNQALAMGDAPVVLEGPFDEQAIGAEAEFDAVADEPARARVEILDAEGTVLGTQEFELAGAGAEESLEFEHDFEQPTTGPFTARVAATEGAFQLGRGELEFETGELDASVVEGCPEGQPLVFGVGGIARIARTFDAEVAGLGAEFGVEPRTEPVTVMVRLLGADDTVLAEREVTVTEDEDVTIEHVFGPDETATGEFTAELEVTEGEAILDEAELGEETAFMEEDDAV